MSSIAPPSAEKDGLPPNILDDLQVLESNSTLTEGTGTHGISAKPPPSSPSPTKISPAPLIQPSLSYVSSASSTTGVPSPFSSQTPQTTGRDPLEPKQLQYPPSPKPHVQMTTIQNSSPRNSMTVRKDSDDGFFNIPPVHAFFNQHPGGMAQYDSDGSNGRYILSFCSAKKVYASNRSPLTLVPSLVLFRKECNRAPIASPVRVVSSKPHRLVHRHRGKTST